LEIHGEYVKADDVQGTRTGTGIKQEKNLIDILEYSRALKIIINEVYVRNPSTGSQIIVIDRRKGSNLSPSGLKRLLRYKSQEDK